MIPEQSILSSLYLWKSGEKPSYLALDAIACFTGWRGESQQPGRSPNSVKEDRSRQSACYLTKALLERPLPRTSYSNPWHSLKINGHFPEIFNIPNVIDELE
jgi:hypothetical protein